jgi:hypothetical protein
VLGLVVGRQEYQGQPGSPAWREKKRLRGIGGRGKGFILAVGVSASAKTVCEGSKFRSGAVVSGIVGGQWLVI